MPSRLVHLRNGNHLARAASAPVLTTGSADALYPLAYAWDRDPGLPFKFAAAVADGKITDDINLVGNPGFEASPLVGWIEENSGTGSTSEEAAIVDTGTKALKCQGGASGIGQRYRTITARAGEQLQLDARIRGDGTVNARLRVYCVELNQWLNSSGAFQAGVTDVATETGTSYATKTRSFTMPSFATLRLHTVTLRVYCRVDQNGAGYFDNVTVYPATDWLSFHGHNVEPGLAIQLRSSTDNFGGVDTLEATAVVLPGRFYVRLPAAVLRRYWRIVWLGTPSVAQQAGEIVLDQSLALPRSPNAGWELPSTRPQVRNRLQSGVTLATVIADEVFNLGLSYEHLFVSEHDTFRDEVLRRCNYGGDPVVFCPIDTEPLCVLGVVGEELGKARSNNVMLADAIAVAELPFAVLAA